MPKSDPLSTYFHLPHYYLLLPCASLAAYSHFGLLNMASINGEAKSYYPDAKSTLPFWRIQPHELDDHRTTEDLPTECDIAIVGGGYAGASTAYHLLNDNASLPSIALLEARQACSGATARNGMV